MKKINILGIEYEIINIYEHIDGMNNAGFIDHDKTRMTIYHDALSKEHSKITLLHEIIHGIVDQQEIDFGDNDEELYIDPRLFPFIKIGEKVSLDELRKSMIDAEL